MAAATAPKLKVLALDGGGIRGLSSLVILKRVMYRLRKKMKNPDLEPWQYFDLIGGTSTGGIIAIMLGRLHMSVDECVTAYSRLGREVFGEPKGKGHEHMFDELKLEEAIKKTIREKLGEGHEDDPLMDPLGDDACKTVVFTLPHAHPNRVEPKALRTYASEHESALPCTIWQAARATSAAPTFFKPLELGEPPHVTKWIDAGMGFNNPSKALRKEAGRIWGDDFGQMDFNSRVGLFLSIGTGFPRIIRLDAETIAERISKKFQVPLKAVEVMKAIVTDTETVHNDMRLDCDQAIYHRFNVEQGLQEVELFEYEKLEEIQTDSDAYLTTREFDITRCVARMSELPVKQPLLAPNEEQQQAVFGNGGDVGEQDLERRLKQLGIDGQKYKHNTKIYENSDTLKEQLMPATEVPYLFHPILQADILDKEGSLLYYELNSPKDRQTQQYRAPPNSSEIIQLSYSVRRKLAAYSYLTSAFQIYRELYHAIEKLWDKQTLEHSWVANRLGNLLEIFGWRDKALELYIEASEGREKTLGKDHKRTMESIERVHAMLGTMDEQEEVVIGIEEVIDFDDDEDYEYELETLSEGSRMAIESEVTLQPGQRPRAPTITIDDSAVN